ncbi:phage tail tape measure protein [Spongiibacter taiwanensis]|uniref:phage tail tape measure protein n=1 Tax=Spongiibacter taiwanensis TaxID=1748242 RepID=UPI00203643D8|nr:phage tail tape measure protein [Spongiibacter taiwanensis]USA43343.1 phage tail tape measure protein [Spongiibacter taiwanensis]
MSNNLNSTLTLRIVDQWSGPAKKLAGINSELARKLSATGNELKNIGNQRKAVARLKEYELASSKAKEASSQAAEKVKQLRLAREKEAEQLKVARAELHKLQDLKASGVKVDAKEIANLKRQAKENKTLIREHERAEKALEQTTKQRRLAAERSVALRKKLKAEGIETRELAAEQKRLGAAYAQTQDRIKAVARAHGQLEAAESKHNETLQKAANTTIVAAGLDRVGRGALNFLRGPTAQAIAFESAMADVKKVVEFDNPAQFKDFAATLLQMTRSIPIAKEGLAAIAAQGGQLGVDRGALPGFVETAAKMSTAFDMLPDQAGEAMAKLSNVYQVPIAEMGNLGDAVNHLSDNTAAKAKEIVDVLLRVGGTATQFGLTTVQTAALGDAFVALGKKPEVAGTAINAMLNKLQTATKQGAKFQDALDEIGISADTMESMIAQNGQGALDEFLAALSQIDKQARAGVLTDLFGLEYSDDISLLAGNLQVYKKALDKVADSADFAGSMSREAENRAATRENQLILLQNRWDEFQTKLGNELLPVIDWVAGAATRLIDALDWLTDKFPGASKVAMILVGGLGALALAVAPVLVAIAALRVAISGLGVSAKRAALQNAAGGLGGAVAGGGKGGGLKGLARGLGSKAGLIGAGIGALSIGSTLMSDNPNINKGLEVSKDLGGMGGALAGGAAGAALGSVVPIVGTAIGGLVGAIAGGMGGEWFGNKVGDWVFGNKGADVAKASVPVSSGAPVVAAGAAGGQNYTDASQYTINVHQQPGENADALVKKTIDEIDRRKTRRRGGSYADHS